MDTRILKANYDLISEDWGRARKTLPPKDRLLFNQFIDTLPEKARILDLGCGTGIPIAKLLSDKGFSLLGIDRSEKLLKVAQENVPNAIFQRGEIEDYHIEGAYEGVVMWDSLFHIPAGKHRAILEKIYQSLTLGGLIILSSGGSEGEIGGFTDFMFGVEFFYDALPPQELCRVCEDIGYKIEQYSIVNHPDGARDKGRIGLILSKP